MKAALLKGPRSVIIEDIPISPVGDDEVQMEIKYCGICGSDLNFYKEAYHAQKDWSGSYPGHEYTGVVTKVGKNVNGFQVGDRVVANPMDICGECFACLNGRPQQCPHRYDTYFPLGVARGGYNKYITITHPDRRLHKLPEGLSFELAAMTEPIASSLHCVERSDFKLGETTVVIGAGPIGLGVIAFLKFGGAGLIIATEFKKKRAELAKKFGADYVFNPHDVPNLKEKVLELTNGLGADRVYMCAGVPEAYEGVFELIRNGGQVMVCDCPEKTIVIDPTMFCYNEWDLKGALVYDFNNYPMALEFMRRRIVPFEEMVTKKIKLSEIVNEGFEVLIRPDHNEVKILVEPE